MSEASTVGSYVSVYAEGEGGSGGPPISFAQALKLGSGRPMVGKPPLQDPSLLKRRYGVFSPGSELGILQEGLVELGGEGSIPPPRLFQTHSANSLIVDFSGHLLSKGESFQIVADQLQGIEGMKFLKKGQLIEVSFLSSEAVYEALRVGIHVGQIQVPLARCFSPLQDILPIEICGIPIYPKGETYEEICKAFFSLGKVCELKFHFYSSSNI